MGKNRLEAFSDAVIAIIITIMVLELKVPHGQAWAALWHLWPVFISYVLSFIYLAIYWNNHHHMLHTVERVNGGILWANMHLLFWLSLVPFVTGWMGENRFAPAATSLYGIVMFMAAVAYFILQNVIIRAHGSESVLKKAVGRDRKGQISMAAYALAIFVAIKWPAVAWILYALVAGLWLVPDQRIERVLKAG